MDRLWLARLKRAMTGVKERHLFKIVMVHFTWTIHGAVWVARLKWAMTGVGKLSARCVIPLCQNNPKHRHGPLHVDHPWGCGWSA